MVGAILIVLAVLVLALSAIATLYVVGIRSQSATVRAAARRFHHAVGNPVQLRSAGTPGTYASVIRHQGRRKGRTYQTPVWAVPTEDGFVIAIVYGAGTDWLKNVLASGAAAIVHQGASYPVDQPEIVPIQRARVVLPGHAAANPSAGWRRGVSAGSAGRGRQHLRRPGCLVSGTDRAGLDWGPLAIGAAGAEPGWIPCRRKGRRR
jgi:hypothetical protein